MLCSKEACSCSLQPDWCWSNHTCHPSCVAAKSTSTLQCRSVPDFHIVLSKADTLVVLQLSNLHLSDNAINGSLPSQWSRLPVITLPCFSHTAGCVCALPAGRSRVHCLLVALVCIACMLLPCALPASRCSTGSHALVNIMTGNR